MALTLVTSDLIHGLDYSKLTGTITTWNQDTTGNAATATLAAGATILATARNIGGVSFNGSAAINLPGVNIAGNQNTSGNAGTVTNGMYTVGDQTIAGVKTFSSAVNVTSADDTRLKLTDTGDSSELIFRSDGANTQIYTNTAHDLGIYTANNVGQLHLKQSTGNVGIGITPTYKLDVGGSSAVIRVKETNGTDVRIVSGGSIGYIGTYTDHELRLLTNGTEKLTISSAGQATFGSTTDYKIGLNDSAGTNQWWLKSYTNGSFAIHKNNVGDKLTILSGGDVLINATSKHTGYTAFTTLKVSSNSGDYFPILEFSGNRDANNGNQNAMIQFWNKTSTAVEVGRITSSQSSGVNYGELQFATASNGTLTERMRITSGGDVQAKGTNLGVTQSDGDYLAKLYQSSSDGFLSLYTGQATPVERVRLSSYSDSWIVPALATGKVGIGRTNPSSKLHLDGSNYNTASETQFTITDHGNNTNSNDTSCRIVMESRYWSGDDNVSTRSAITNIKDNGNGSSGSAMAFHTTSQGAGAYSEKLRIDSSGDATFGRRIFAKSNTGGNLMYTPRAIEVPHGTSSTLFSFDFDPVTLWGFSVTGGFVKIEASGWSNRIRTGYIHFQNAGSGAPLTVATFYESAGSGTGTISAAALNPGVNNTIRVSFANWHGNAHAWNCFISSYRY